MNNKKFVALSALALASAITLGSCGGTKAQFTETFYYDFTDAFMATVRTELDKELATLGVKNENRDGKKDQSTQSAAIDAAIAAGVNALLVNIVDTSAASSAESIVKKAKDADKPVIFFNREVADEVVKAYEKAIFVGTDAPQAGKIQGEMIFDYIKANKDTVDKNKDGKIEYVMFRCDYANQEAIYRTYWSIKTAQEMLNKEDIKLKLTPSALNTDTGSIPDWVKEEDKIIFDKHLYCGTGWSGEEAAKKLDGADTANKGALETLELVVANNDGTALGGLGKLQEKGYNKDNKEKWIPIFGVDATDDAKAKIKEGTMTGSVLQSAPALAKAVAFALKNALDGKPLTEGAKEAGYAIDEGVNKIRVSYEKWTTK